MKELFRYIQSDYYRYTGEMRGGVKYYFTFFSNGITALITVFGYGCIKEEHIVPFSRSDASSPNQ